MNRMNLKNRIMKKGVSFLFFFLMLGLLLPMTKVDAANTAQAAESTETYSRYINASALNIRKKPSKKAKVVGQYPRRKKITCYGKTKNGKWTKVKYKGKIRYVATEFLSKKKPPKIYTRYVKASSLNIRKKPSKKAKIVGTYSYGKELTCYGKTKNGKWTKVKYKGKTRYVASEFLTKSKPKDSASSASSGGYSVADYARQFVGNPYKWGGSSLTHGADCSGFTMAVFAHFGYSLPHSSVSQRSCGTGVSWEDKRPGDLICYNSKGGNSHVGIYIGDGLVVHASNKRDGIKISSAGYRSVNCVRRIIQ